MTSVEKRKFKEYKSQFRIRFDSYMEIDKIKRAEAYKYTNYYCFFKDGSVAIMNDKYYDIYLDNMPGGKFYIDAAHLKKEGFEWPRFGNAYKRRWKNIKTGKFTSPEIEKVYNS